MFSEKEMSKRIAEMVFEPSPGKLVKWLILVTQGKVSYEEDTIFIESLNGVNYGFLFDSDPVTKAVMIASSITSPSLWTKEELLIIEKLSGSRPLIDIVRAVQKYHQDKETGIKRNRNAVRVKLMRMGLGWRCTEDYMTAYEWSRQLGIGKWRVSNWVGEGYLKPRKIARNQNAISIKQMSTI